MERIVRVDRELLDFALTLSPEDRLRQADAAFRLFEHLHRPYARPFVRGFDSVEDLWRFDEEERLPH
jgi:hypothetical protein